MTAPADSRISDELLPCPFCGSHAEMEPWHGGAPTKQLIQCADELCDACPSVTGETPAEAIANWNRRAELRERRAQAVTVKPVAFRYRFPRWEADEWSMPQSISLLSSFPPDDDREIQHLYAAPPPAQAAGVTEMVTRLREVEEWFHGRRSGKLEAARIVRETIEALTSQLTQHTEPVAGEVEVVGFRWRMNSDTHWSGVHDIVLLPSTLNDGREIEKLVTKSSYDALAAGKDRLEQEMLEKAREVLDALTQAEIAKHEAERQRDALRELLADALDEHDTSHGEITDPDDPHWSVRARALKDDGGSRP